MNYSTGSVKRLSECHPDLVRVFLEVGRATDVTILEGAISLEDARADGILDSDQLHRPSDGLRASPSPFSWPTEPTELADLSTGAQESVRRYSQDVARWHYLSGVVTGVAQTLYDRGLIDAPIEWIGSEDPTRYSRKCGTNGKG